MASNDLYETPDHRPLAEHVSPAGDLREYIYGEFEDDDDRWDVCTMCGGHSGEYEDCEFDFAGSPYVPGPGGPNTHGCPRMTGTF